MNICLSVSVWRLHSLLTFCPKQARSIDISLGMSDLKQVSGPQWSWKWRCPTSSLAASKELSLLEQVMMSDIITCCSKSSKSLLQQVKMSNIITCSSKESYLLEEVKMSDIFICSSKELFILQLLYMSRVGKLLNPVMYKIWNLDVVFSQSSIYKTN